MWLADAVDQGWTRSTYSSQCRSAVRRKLFLGWLAYFLRGKLPKEWQMSNPTSVFIGGVGDDLKREDLEREFSKYGRLNSIWVAQNPPGFAFIEFDDGQDADDAIREMNGTMINGSKIRVEMSRGRRRGRGDEGAEEGMTTRSVETISPEEAEEGVIGVGGEVTPPEAAGAQAIEDPTNQEEATAEATAMAIATAHVPPIQVVTGTSTSGHMILPSTFTTPHFADMNHGAMHHKIAHAIMTLINEDEILNKNFDDDSETENYSLNESSDVSTDEECDSILTTVQMSSRKSKTPKSKELSLPTQIVLDISRPLWKSNRNITADNWFTSIELVDKLKEHGLTYLGTMRKNKPQIPPQFQPHPKRESGTSIFGFSGTKTLVSYVPKKRKSVILISSMHHDNKCDKTTGKPDIIMDYNLTKGSVDTIDQMVSNFSTSCRSRRWPLALFYALLDITALNSYIIFNYQIDKKDQKERSTFIVDLGRSLIDEHLATRNLNSLPLELQTTIKKFKNNDGSSTSRGSTMPQESDTPKRCYKYPSKNAGKVKTLCSVCQFEAVPNMEADAFAADSNMSTDAAPPYPWSGTLAEVYQLGQLKSGFLKRSTPLLTMLLLVRDCLFVRVILLVSQLAFISEGRSPIRHLGTRPIAVSSAKGDLMRDPIGARRCRSSPPMPIVAAVIPFSGKVACKITFNCRNLNFKMVELSELSYYQYCRITIENCT
ncbi:hypothetical protein LAZ67_2003897 [Cordylochernes scorpioides]|uniref:RRM domain-containing protein n=1 Tax=Cordylochernes scorpioides TaxID=51811 RepID=A0ABY6K3J3_9ARAC|nr:hypothetical protein LAZ67_2003897 [Cordylochernes scorpioides]